jgi:hypothetical protein
MQIVIEVDDSAVNEMMDYFRRMKEKVRVLHRDAIVLEPVEEEDPDRQCIEDARRRREAGEALYDLDEVMREFS